MRVVHSGRCFTSARHCKTYCSPCMRITVMEHSGIRLLWSARKVGCHCSNCSSGSVATKKSVINPPWVTTTISSAGTLWATSRRNCSSRAPGCLAESPTGGKYCGSCVLRSHIARNSAKDCPGKSPQFARSRNRPSSTTGKDCTKAYMLPFLSLAVKDSCRRAGTYSLEETGHWHALA